MIRARAGYPGLVESVTLYVATVDLIKQASHNRKYCNYLAGHSSKDRILDHKF